MTGYELSDLLASNRELIYTTWNYFLSVHLAIFGLIFIVSDRAGVFERVVLVGAYIGFMILNYAAQLDNYDNYCRIIDQIAMMPGSSPGAMEAKSLLDLKVPWIIDWLIYIYLAAIVVASFIIMLINRNKSRGSRLGD